MRNLLLQQCNQTSKNINPQAIACAKLINLQMKKIIQTCLLLATISSFSQTEIDGVMMAKGYLCSGIVYEHSSWTQYWEGTFKRENLNLGVVSTNRTAVNFNYGISSKLNAIVSLPFVSTKATVGTLIGQQGLQDLSMTLKYMPVEINFGNKTFACYVFGGYSIPVTDYVADYLPLSIGLKSRVATVRAMADFQWKNVFATTSIAYNKRSNIEIDRNTYYTTRMHYTNLVDMPDAINLNARLGYRTQWLIAEAVLDTWNTLGETFDITTNNMPFPSNTMNMTRLGINIKYTFKKMPELALIGGGNYVTSGRNVGQSTAVYGGIFYLIKIKKDKKSAKSQS